MGVAALVICHGGSGAIMGALTRGLPLLLLPQGADQFDNTQQCVQRGVAHMLTGDQATATAIRDQVCTLLNDRSIRTAARQVGQEIAELPDVASTVPLFTQLARTHLPVT
jgi:UDP:flavonoid glycosyltransferase YjiC (YdhE family)